MKFTNLFLFKEKMLHLVDDIFWHLGFKSAEHAQQVMSHIIDIVIIAMIMIILSIIGSRPARGATPHFFSCTAQGFLDLFVIRGKPWAVLSRYNLTPSSYNLTTGL